MSKGIMMVTASNKADIFELLQTIWTQPTSHVLKEMFTDNRAEASMTENYHAMVSKDIRKDILRRKSKTCFVIGEGVDVDVKHKYIKASFIKEHYMELAKYLTVIEEIGEVYSITEENAESFIEDYILPTMCNDELMVITAMCNRFVVTNKETGAGYNRHSMLISTGALDEAKLHEIHNAMKLMNKFRPFSKSEMVYRLLPDEKISIYKCDSEQVLTFPDLQHIYHNEIFKDLQKLYKRSVCYFNEKTKGV